MNFKNLVGEFNVLIPDGCTKLSLSVIKSLSKARNVNIHILSSKKWYETRFSRHISSFTFYKTDDDKDLIDKINQINLNKDIKVILPVNVPMIQFLSINQKLINLPVVVPDIEKLDIANNKWKLAGFTEEVKLPIPRTFELDTDEWIGKLAFPLILKPKCSWNGNDIFKIEDIEKLHKKKRELNSCENYLCQEYIEGFDIDMSVLCINGKILAFAIQKEFLKNSSPYKPPLGIEFLNKKKLYKIVKILMHELNWSGVAHIDLRYDTIENEYKIIEMNPRFWGSVEASNKVGINFPYLYCLSSLGIHFEAPAYKFEKYVNNRGLIKILKSKILSNSPKYKIPKHTSLTDDLLDPIPKMYKYMNKALKKVLS